MYIFTIKGYYNQTDEKKQKPKKLFKRNRSDKALIRNASKYEHDEPSSASSFSALSDNDMDIMQNEQQFDDDINQNNNDNNSNSDIDDENPDLNHQNNNNRRNNNHNNNNNNNEGLNEEYRNEFIHRNLHRYHHHRRHRHQYLRRQDSNDSGIGDDHMTLDLDLDV